MAEHSSSPSKGDREIGEAIQYLIQGKRHLLVQDYVSAVESLEEACQLYAHKYGELANECGEPYLYYGKALLELARMENGVLGNALEGVPNEEESESEEDSQVESPENISEEEREKIKRDVDAAIDENSRDLEEKMNQLKGNAEELNLEKEKPTSESKECEEEKAHDDTNVKADASRANGPKNENTDVASSSNDVETTNGKVEENLENDKEISNAVEENSKDDALSESERKGENDEKAECGTETIEDDRTPNDTESKGEEALSTSKVDADESMEEDEDETEEATTNQEKETDSAEPGPAGSNEKVEEITNLQLAWEILELAKIIFKRQSETDDKIELKMAETLLKLGEIGIESENYKQAIVDLSECLALQKRHLTPDDRAIAETFYQLGLACSFYGQYEESIENFHKSMRVIEERIANLQQGVQDGMTKSGDSTEDPVEAAKREMEELKSILPDIQSKVEDTEDLMKNSAAAIKEAALQRLHEETTPSSPPASEISSTDQSNPKPATNISHLLKRKVSCNSLPGDLKRNRDPFAKMQRKSDSSADVGPDVETKKKRAASGGDQVSNGTPNGKAPPITEADGMKDVETAA